MTACHRFDPARRRGIIGPARPVRGDLSSVAGCCCPLLYSYVGRRRVISYRRGHHLPGAGCRSAASSARRGAQIGGIIGPALGADRRHHRPGPARGSGVAWPVQRPAAGCDLLPARHHRAATEKPPTENGQQKRGRRGGGPCLPLFFASFFRVGHFSGVSSGAGGWNPSRAILSRVAVKMYPCTLSPA